MPGLITHYICGDVCLNRLENTAAKNILIKNRQIYNVGVQGPDVFFYYLPCLFRKSIFQLGNTLHNTKVGSFFDAIVTLIDGAENMSDKEAAAAYLSGYLTHYTLDKNAHPYIYYKSGFKTDGGASRKLKYSVNHRNFETNIDILMLNMISSQKPSDKKLWELLKVSFKDMKATASLLGFALRNVYEIHLTKRQIYHAFYSMCALNRMIQSRSGKRKHIMAFIEDFTVHERLVTSLIHDQTVKSQIDYLNLKRQPWCFPWEDTVEYTDTFTDMFEQSVTEAKIMIEGLFAFLNGKLSKNALIQMIGNKSMSTGMDSDLKPIQQ